MDPIYAHLAMCTFVHIVYICVPCCLLHGVVPSNCGCDVVIPLIKDKTGYGSTRSNYITIEISLLYLLSLSYLNLSCWKSVKTFQYLIICSLVSKKLSLAPKLSSVYVTLLIVLATEVALCMLLA